MSDIAQRYINNPLLSPSELKPSCDELMVTCVFNPGAFRFENKIWLLLRVAERPRQQGDKVSLPILENGKIKIMELSKRDPELDYSDPRTVAYKGRTYLTTLSHLRLCYSDDGESFQLSSHPPILGQGPLETFGIEDCRVVEIDGTYYITYSAVSENGFGVGMISTSNWSVFHRHGMIISGPNKDCAIFPEKIDGEYWSLHRPCNQGLGGNYIWTACSKDLNYWGKHKCLAWTRDKMWDSERIGAGGPPIKTDQGWLVIYHGADSHHRYCLGTMLLALENPSRILARSIEPIMEPIMDYEKKGFFGNVVFSNGHIVEGDRIRIYYGASDEAVCGANISLEEILGQLKKN